MRGVGAVRICRGKHLYTTNRLYSTNRLKSLTCLQGCLPRARNVRNPILRQCVLFRARAVRH